MKLGSTLFLKFVLFLIAVLALTFLLVFPHFEGRNANATVFEVYFNDPFLAYSYLSSIPFFFALLQGFKILGYIEKNKAFSDVTVKALRNIKFSALILAGCILLAMPYIFILAQSDDAPGVVLIGIVIVFASVVVATAAAVFQKLLQNAVDIKSENDLTV